MLEALPRPFGGPAPGSQAPGGESQCSARGRWHSPGPGDGRAACGRPKWVRKDRRFERGGGAWGKAAGVIGEARAVPA